MTEQQKQDYIGNYLKYEGIQLEYANIKKNPGLRTLAKMMLNSMWGKFGQRLNKTRVQEFDDPQTFHQFLNTDTMDVRHVSIINDQMVEVHYQHQKEDIPVSPNLQHLHRLFYHLSCPDQTLRDLAILGRTSTCTTTQTPSSIAQTRVKPTQPWVNYLGDFTSELDKG